MARDTALMARRWIVRGRVQGVGFRDFVQRRALEIGVRGFVRNLSDGSVEVVGAGTVRQLDELAGHLHKGPWLSEVRAVDETEAAVPSQDSFVVRY
jgi:acylphosphatase